MFSVNEGVCASRYYGARDKVTNEFHSFYFVQNCAAAVVVVCDTQCTRPYTCIAQEIICIYGRPDKLIRRRCGERVAKETEKWRHGEKEGDERSKKRKPSS